MVGYRDLPMGRHDMEAMSSPKVLTAFQQFVALEQRLAALLRDRQAQNRQILGEMGLAGGS